MINFKNLSFWEKQSILEAVDFVVVGAGIVGSACAIELRKLYPSAKILLIERGFLPTGASTKNAGFACFGSLTEIADDLKNAPESEVWETVAMRYEGLKRLMERFDPKEIDYQQNGSWDLILTSENEKLKTYSEFIPNFNENIQRITGKGNCFSYDTSISEKTGFQNILGGFQNHLEGEINTGKLHLATQRLLAENSIYILYGIEIEKIIPSTHSVEIVTQYGSINSAKVAITTNGFAKQFLPNHDVLPARAQVLVTSELNNFKLPGCFHYDSGYYYFRSVGNRILLGGGRNMDFEGETTTDLSTTDQITNRLIDLLKTTIIPNREFSIDYQWAGIMGIGKTKRPIIEKTHDRVAIGVRMGGMGVAIGSLVGENVARII